MDNLLYLVHETLWLLYYITQEKIHRVDGWSLLMLVPGFEFTSEEGKQHRKSGQFQTDYSVVLSDLLKRKKTDSQPLSYSGFFTLFVFCVSTL